MRITQERLRKLIREEYNRMAEAGEEAAPEAAADQGPSRVDPQETMMLVKQALVAGGAKEDEFLAKVLNDIATLIGATNIATDTQALRGADLIAQRAAKV